jgi:hypothetical protein
MVKMMIAGKDLGSFADLGSAVSVSLTSTQSSRR